MTKQQFSPKIRLTLLAATLAILAPSTHAWHAVGHMAVARIAVYRLNMTQEGRDTLNWATKLLNPLKQQCGEDKHPFTEAAEWPDKIKRQTWTSFNYWHFTNYEVLAPDYTPKEPILVQQNDIIQAITDIAAFLSSDPQPHKGVPPLLGQSLSLRQLIHFVGDIHQPLHVINRYSNRFPEQEGDLGGNRFKIQHYNVTYWNNLHWIWDHIFDQPFGVGPTIDIGSPLSDKDWIILSNFSQKVMNLHTYDDLKLQMMENSTLKDWADEGYKIANSFSYDGIEFGKELPQEYIDKAIDIVNKRLRLGATGWLI